MFAKLGLLKGKEKAKYRSIMFNIKDDKNPDFRRRILLGKVKPKAVCTLTSDEMASDQRKKEIENIKAKAMFECEWGMQAVASTDQVCQMRATKDHLLPDADQERRRAHDHLCFLLELQCSLEVLLTRFARTWFLRCHNFRVRSFW